MKVLAQAVPDCDHILWEPGTSGRKYRSGQTYLVDPSELGRVGSMELVKLPTPSASSGRSLLLWVNTAGKQLASDSPTVFSDLMRDRIGSLIGDPDQVPESWMPPKRRARESWPNRRQAIEILTEYVAEREPPDDGDKSDDEVKATIEPSEVAPRLEAEPPSSSQISANDRLLIHFRANPEKIVEMTTRQMADLIGVAQPTILGTPTYKTMIRPEIERRRRESGAVRNSDSAYRQKDF